MELRRRCMTARRVLVVGGGVAGVSAALAASVLGAKTTLVESAERVGLSRALLPLVVTDGWAEDDLVLPRAGALEGLGVDIRAGETVESIRRRGGEIRLESSPGFGDGAFDSAVVCTGAAAEPPQLRGASKQNVFVMRAPADYAALSARLESLGSVVVSGPIPLALKLGEAMATKGKRVHVYCGREGLERQFSGPVAEEIRRCASGRFEAERLALVDGSLDSILGVERAEAVVSGGSVRACDAVVIVPRSVPSVPAVDCERGRNGGLLVDLSMSTSLAGVFAAGDSAEVRFKSGSLSARLHSTSRACGEVAGTNAAGGSALASPSWAVEQTYFGMEFCSAGLGEEEAKSMGLEASTATAESKCPRSPWEDGDLKTLVSVVFDTATHQVYGIQAAGWRASSLSTAASLIVSLGLTVEQLLHLEAPYSPGSGYDVSPISLTARKIPDAPGS